MRALRFHRVLAVGRYLAIQEAVVSSEQALQTVKEKKRVNFGMRER